MPLTFRPEHFAYHFDSDTVRFNATAEDGSMVVCAVSEEALNDFEQSSVICDEVVPIFLRHRQHIEAVAQRLYAARRIQPSGIVLITTHDLNVHAPTAH